MNQRAIRMFMCATRLAVVASLLLLFAFASRSSTLAQPNPGIEPCSRVLASLASPVPIGTPEQAGNRVAVSQTIMNFASCFNRRNVEGVLALSDEEFRASMFGVTEPDGLRDKLDRLDRRGLLPQIRILSIEENGTTGTNMASMIVTWQGWQDVHQELWRVERHNGNWLLTERTIQTPHQNRVAVGVQFRIDTDGLSAPLNHVANPGIVLLAFDNTLDSDVIALVVLVDSDADVSSVTADCNRSSETVLSPMGQIQVPFGETVTMLLQELNSGRYAVIVGGDPCAGHRPISENEVQILDVEAAEIS